ncbi:MAG: class I SAM-dependent methyltransferase [Planctomycetes bacterium]|nr:class I SAM-dependent methyltransferase [Planctomycetota bacterium]
MLSQVIRVLTRPGRIHSGEGCAKQQGLALHIEPRVTQEDRFVLRQLLEKVARPGMVVVEIGSFLGNGSTRTMCETIGPLGGALYCVDTWRGNDNVEWHQQLARTHDLFNTFRHNVGVFGATPTVKPLLMTSLDAARIFADETADLVFIDGDHAYQGVKQDIEIWRRKVRQGGILCGHDCEGRTDEFGEERVRRHCDEDFVRLNGHTFAGFHPGPVRAVAELLGPAAVLWCHQDLSAHGHQGRRSSIWHVMVKEAHKF